MVQLHLWIPEIPDLAECMLFLELIPWEVWCYSVKAWINSSIDGNSHWEWRLIITVIHNYHSDTVLSEGGSTFPAADRFPTPWSVILAETQVPGYRHWQCATLVPVAMDETVKKLSVSRRFSSKISGFGTFFVYDFSPMESICSPNNTSIAKSLWYQYEIIKSYIACYWSWG